MSQPPSRAKCTQCEGELSPGFLGDTGQSSSGFIRWIEGQLERGMFGGAKAWGRPKWAIDAYRCIRCGHLELWATEPL